MKLVIFRHGPAGKREEWEAEGRDDRLRPLTSKGKKEVRKAAAGLATLVPALEVLATSPLTRAVQTAEIVAAEYGCEIDTLDALAPDADPAELLPWLRAHASASAVGVVGHEPHLGLQVGHLLTGKGVSVVDLKKGGACLIEISDAPRPGGGMLEWLLTDRELRRLAE